MTKYAAAPGRERPKARDPYYLHLAKTIYSYAGSVGDSVLDIGSGSAHLLGALKELGFTDLWGVDGSPQCALEAQRLYGIAVATMPVTALANLDRTFDLVLLTSVVEHLHNPQSMVAAIARVTSPGGAAIIEIPDAERFDLYMAAPFQQFSHEHINYFSAGSLRQLFQEHGFYLQSARRELRFDGDIPEPALVAIFRRDPVNIVLDEARDMREVLSSYVRDSARVEEQLLDRIGRLRETQEEVVVWPVGALTLRLLKKPAFRGLNISAFLDANPRYQGKTIEGIKVLSPADAEIKQRTIVVGSLARESEIMEEATGLFGLDAPVFTLFPSHYSRMLRR